MQAQVDSRIVVIRPGALGDVLLTLPALRYLREQHPKAALEVVGYPDIWEVAGDLVDRVTAVDRSMFAGLFSGRPSAELTGWLEGTDLIVAWTARDVSAALVQATPARVVQASPYPPPGTHAARWMMETVGVPKEEMGRRAAEPLGLPEETIPHQPWTVLHPGAGAVWKRWPAERFAQLAELLEERGHRPTLLEGPADADAVANVQAALSRPLPAMREPSLLRLAAALHHARLFIGNDSGATHLAAAAGAPTIALFGPTDPVSWAPPYPWAQVIRACTHGTTQQGTIRACEDPGCMEGISVMEVARSIDEGGISP